MKEKQAPIARAIAVVAHKGQKYGTGPYINHPAAVAKMIHLTTQGNDTLVAAAWLHDVLEDTLVTMRDLQAAGIGHAVRDIVFVLTRDKHHETYERYITRVAEHREASKIKVADLMYNLLHSPRETLRKRYFTALSFLEARLARSGSVAVAHAALTYDALRDWNDTQR